MSSPLTDDEPPFEVLHPDPIRRVDLAMQDLQKGRMIILVDDEDRENEGDLVIAAEKVTPEAINFMAKYARGLICLSLRSEQVDKLGLSMMATSNQSAYQTAFTVSIEAREGVTTGISAGDRSHTVHTAIKSSVSPRDIVTPGHIFPLRARDGGVLERVGQTEGSVDIARLAGLNPSGVICEIMNDDGSMARMPELEQFGQEHRIRIAAVADLIKYRMRSERVVAREGEGRLTIDGLGEWRTRLYSGLGTGGLHQVFWKGELTPEPTLVRVQTAPPPWAFLHPGSPPGRSARAAFEAIDHAGEGAVVFMHLASPLDALRGSFLAEFEGQEVASRIPRADALRDLGTGCQILVDLGLRDLRLLTSSRRAIVGLEAYGLRIEERVPLITPGGSDR